MYVWIAWTSKAEFPCALQSVPLYSLHTSQSKRRRFASKQQSASAFLSTFVLNNPTHNTLLFHHNAFFTIISAVFCLKKPLKILFQGSNASSSPSTTQPTSMADADIPSRCWQCTKCGRRYVDPSPTSIFIVPPPITTCLQPDSAKIRSHADGGCSTFPLTIVGTDCDYQRMQNAGQDIDIDLSAQVTEPHDGAHAVDSSMASDQPTQVCDGASMKTPGESGRISRYGEVTDAADDMDDTQDCDFWRMDCKDIDCIYKGQHCRYQCAMAELDEEPKPLLSALKRSLKFKLFAG